MTWGINFTGHDNLSGDEKAALEQSIVDEVTALFESLKAKEGNNVVIATVSTNTTGSVNLLAPPVDAVDTKEPTEDDGA